MLDKEKALRAAQAKLARQIQNHEQTLAELEHVNMNKPNALALIGQLRNKRDRQKAMIEATRQLVELYTDPPADTPPAPKPKR